MSGQNNKMVDDFFKLTTSAQIEILSSENVKKLDYETLIKFQNSDNYYIRGLARNLALEVPAEKLDYKNLFELQNSDNHYVRGLVRKILLKNFEKELDKKKIEFIKEYFSSSKFLD